MKQLIKPILILLGVAAAIRAADVTPPPLPPLTRSTARPAAAVAEQQPVFVTLSWEYPASELTPDITFKVYQATSLVSQWSSVTNVVGTNSVKIQVIPGTYYFTVKAYSAFWNIETPFSDAISTPAQPRNSQNLSVKRAE